MLRKRNLYSKKENSFIAYQDCPAKTYEDESGNKQLGRSVFDHCQIVGEVAKELIKRSDKA